MRPFEYVSPTTVDEALALCSAGWRPFPGGLWLPSRS